MKYNYQNISISKDFYKTAEGFSKCLERLAICTIGEYSPVHKHFAS